MSTSTKIRRVGVALFAVMAISACAGEDYTPVYLQPQEGEAPPAAPSGGAPARQCNLSFTSELCVSIKGVSIDVGTKEDDRLCAEVPAFPIHIDGAKATIKGSEFPDVEVEGHGLPAPITINARGDGDGEGNTAEGDVDSAGNMTIKNFSLFIVALGVVGEIKDLTLTTASTEELPDLPSIEGSPPDASGAMTLVTGTELGHVIDAADEFLMGASLTASFAGSITPPFSQCAGSGEKNIEVKKLFISLDGRQTEVPIPDGKIMEVSSGTYISETPADIGERFETTAKFRIKNVGTAAQTIQIPPRAGPFYLSSIESLTRILPPSQSFVLGVTFKPSVADQPGVIEKTISIGPDQFVLVGDALPKTGKVEVDVVDDEGKTEKPNVDQVLVGDAEVPAGAERAFFACKEIECSGARSFTNCKVCEDPSKNPCELLPVSTAGRPVGEVDNKCSLKDPFAAPMLTIDLKGAGSIGIGGFKQVLALRNKGVAELTISNIVLEEVKGTRSRGQFSIPAGAIFIAKKFSDIQEKVNEALADKESNGAKRGSTSPTPPYKGGGIFPLTLVPFKLGYDESTLYIVVTYTPSDLIGANGEHAGAGSRVKDEAVIKIVTDTGEMATKISGTTTIREEVALELYFRTSVGTREIADGSAFPVRGVTAETIDLAVPLFLRTADTAQNTLRITSIAIDGGDTDNFRWLDTAEKIAAVTPPSGKGMRCSIPEVDESTGEMVSESFDLKPVSLAPPGFDIAPGAYSTQTMPLFGCIDFHSDEGSRNKKKLYEAFLAVTAEEVDSGGMPIKNPDGSARQINSTIRLQAAPVLRSGPMVLRITQTMAAILNPKFPSLSAISARSDMMEDFESGRGSEKDVQVFTGGIILDPFDEMTVRTSDGEKVVSTPNDGITAVFRNVDTHPVSQNYDDESLFDYAKLQFDGSLPTGSKGVFEDYPNVPEDAKANGWRIFSASLSYPGPLEPVSKRPEYPSLCEVIDPCSSDGLKLFTKSGADAKGKGACAFFYVSGARYDSPAFHAASEMEGGEYENLCNRIDKPQNLLDANTGRYTVDGVITLEEAGLRFFGPTYFHNPGGPLGSMPPLDQVFYTSFTTGVIKPPSNPKDLNVIPDPRINLAKNEFKINLNDRSLDTPPICPGNTKNRTVRGKTTSTWRYIEKLLFKDEEATVPAGCPDDGNDFTGGQAFLRGRDMDQETGILTVVAAAKFGSSKDLTFAFQDVMMFVILNGWMCDPTGPEEDLEGARCYDVKFNDRDAESQFSIMK